MYFSLVAFNNNPNLFRIFAMFSSGANYNKLKTNLRLCINRLKLLEKKKSEMAMKSRKVRLKSQEIKTFSFACLITGDCRLYASRQA